MKSWTRLTKPATLPSKLSTTPLLVNSSFSAPWWWQTFLTQNLELDTLSEESYKDSTLIMQLLRDNLVSAWILLELECQEDEIKLTQFLLRLSGLRPKPSQLLLRLALHLLRQRRPRLHQRRLRQMLNRWLILALMFGTSGTSDKGWDGLLACLAADETKIGWAWEESFLEVDSKNLPLDSNAPDCTYPFPIITAVYVSQDISISSVLPYQAQHVMLWLMRFSYCGSLSGFVLRWLSVSVY